MRRHQALVYLVALCAVVSLVYSAAHQCRCRDRSAACWPTSEEWDAFNATVGGRLIVPKPTGSPCHDPHYNATLCHYIQENYFDSYLRASNPGSMQNENWEDLGQKTCSMNAPASAACHQGQVPVLGVQVEATSDIQNAITFAARHNLRLVVKTSGHDYMGRSTAAGSFLIWTHKLKSITIRESFVPSGTRDAPAKAITVGGGVGWGEVYDVLEPTGWIVVGGMSRTVGVTGGYVQGGGHGVLGPSFGLAVDSVLEIEVVTADGKVRITNSHKNADLFFALRGGGGGTFGVVTSVTYKLHRSPKELVGVVLNLVPSNNTTSWASQTQEDVLAAWCRESVALDAARWGGYWSLGAARFRGFFLVPATRAEVDAAVARVLKPFLQMETVTLVGAPTFPVSSFQVWHRTVYGFLFPKTRTDYVGQRLLLGSRIIPLAAVRSDPRRVAKNILAAAARTGHPGVLGLTVIGPGVRHADARGETAVTPAWRKGLWEVSSTSEWAWNATAWEKRKAQRAAKAFVVSLRSAYPGSGTYQNEACVDEPGWQQSFWGWANYARLLATKVRVDPSGLFVCRHCVGSELWDESGNCRRGF